MHDPQRHPNQAYSGALTGIASAFIPIGATGILLGIVIILVIGIATGVIDGVLVVVAAVVIAGAVALIPRAIRAEIRREDRRSVRLEDHGTLPDDSQISDEERRDAMREFRDDRDRQR